ncbi:MAG TPA: DinB family protein [Pseudacidobacterium sp.]|nr:DinB family protein [Pseudacidobacterium sp.]
MKKIAFFTVLFLACSAYSQTTPAEKPTLRSILLAQMKETHNQKEWFVPANVAVAGLTADQANWKDGKGNHSVGQLAYHLVYWDTRSLEKFKGEPTPKFSGNNDETFDNFDSKKWDETVRQLDAVLTEWEKAIATADDAKLEQWASDIEKISAHNAYHIGQIIYVRKEQGSWNPENGVK